MHYQNLNLCFSPVYAFQGLKSATKNVLWTASCSPSHSLPTSLDKDIVQTKGLTLGPASINRLSIEPRITITHIDPTKCPAKKGVWSGSQNHKRERDCLVFYCIFKAWFELQQFNWALSLLVVSGLPPLISLSCFEFFNQREISCSN